jgi:hypothetical protein
LCDAHHPDLHARTVSACRDAFAVERHIHLLDHGVHGFGRARASETLTVPIGQPLIASL